VEAIVMDEGPGFEPGEEHRLFDIFFRSGRTALSRSGSGIGLYVARVLVEAMHGRIWARLRPEGGAEFGFALPVVVIGDGEDVDTGDGDY
jgi:K+-sensing histidine kinase KdpD